MQVDRPTFLQRYLAGLNDGTAICRLHKIAFMYDPPLVRYNDAKKIYEDYEVISDQSYSESTDLQELLSGEGFD